MNTVYLLLGGNLGEVKNTFEKAITHLENKIGKVTQKSSLYQTEPWGNKNQPKFINQAIEVKSNLFCPAVLEHILEIEAVLGRKRNDIQWSERIIDIDILFYNNQVIHLNNLIVPHPHLHNRNFTLVPLTEIVPDFIHPILNKTIKNLLNESTDQLKVKKLTPSTIGC